MRLALRFNSTSSARPLAALAAAALAVTPLTSIVAQVQTIVADGWRAATYDDYGIKALAVANGRVYFTDWVRRDDGDAPQSEYGQVWSAPAAGGAAPVLLDPSTAGYSDHFGTLAATASYVYGGWNYQCARVNAISGGTTQTIASLGSWVVGLSVDSGNLWLANSQNTLRQFGLAGGTPRASRTISGLVPQTLVAARSGLSIYQQYVFFVAGGNIYRWNGIDTYLTPIETSALTARDISVDGQYVWWIGQSGTQQSVNRVSRAGAGNVVRYLPENGATIREIIQDADNIYLCVWRPIGGTIIRRLPKAGTTPADVATGASDLMAQDSQYLYFAADDGRRINRVLKTATIYSRRSW